MPMDKTVLGNAIQARLIADGYLLLDNRPGTDADTKAIWQAVADELIKHVISFATITLAAADIHITPGTFQVVVGPATIPVTGQGEIAPAVLTGKIS